MNRFMKLNFGNSFSECSVSDFMKEKHMHIEHMHIGTEKQEVI